MNNTNDNSDWTLLADHLSKLSEDEIWELGELVLHCSAFCREAAIGNFSVIQIVDNKWAYARSGDYIGYWHGNLPMEMCSESRNVIQAFGYITENQFDEFGNRNKSADEKKSWYDHSNTIEIPTSGPIREEFTRASEGLLNKIIHALPIADVFRLRRNDDGTSTISVCGQPLKYLHRIEHEEVAQAIYYSILIAQEH